MRKIKNTDRRGIKHKLAVQECDGGWFACIVANRNYVGISYPVVRLEFLNMQRDSTCAAEKSKPLTVN